MALKLLSQAKFAAPRVSVLKKTPTLKNSTHIMKPTTNHISHTSHQVMAHPTLVQKKPFSSEANSSNLPQVNSKLLVLGGNEMMKVVPLEQDPTAKVYFHNAPNDSEEDKETAGLLGFNSFFLARNSYYSIKFQSKQEMALDSYTEMLKLDFFSRVPYGTVSEVHLDPELTSHLAPFEFSAFFFDKKGRPDAVQRSAEMTLVLKSPGGFWSICCFGSWYTLASQKEIFFGNLLNCLKAELVKPEEGKGGKPEELQQALENALEQTKKKMMPKKKKNKQNKFMQVGHIGVLNLKQEKNTPEDDYE